MNCSICNIRVTKEDDFSVSFYAMPIMRKDWYCIECAYNLKKRSVATGYVPISLQKANWERSAAMELGMDEVRMPGQQYTYFIDKGSSIKGLIIMSEGKQRR